MYYKKAMLYKYTLLLLLTLVLLVGCSGTPPLNISSAEPQEQAWSQASSPSDANPESLPAVPDAVRETETRPVILPDPDKKVYLTFDDGPNSHYTGLILDILNKYDVKATFVVVGSNIERNPDVFNRILAEGHGVVNHTYSHDYKKIYETPQAFLADLERCDQAIAPVAGSGTNIFRAPGGPSALKKSFFELLNKHGYKSLGWNVSSADTDPKGISPEQITENVKSGVIRVENIKRAPIILMHDGTEINLSVKNPSTAVQNYIRNRESDVAALPDIIEFLLARGYTFALVDENTPAAW